MKDMHIVQEMYARGFEFWPIDIYKAKAHHFQIIDGKLMPALSTIEGLGDKAADQLEAAAVALVSPRQDSDVAERPVVAPQQGAQDHLGVRSLACAARRDVADADGRYLTGADFEDAVVVASVPQLQRQIIWCKKNLVKHRLQRYKKS